MSSPRFLNVPGQVFAYSKPLDEALYLHDKRYFSAFAPRIHKDAHLADEGCHQHFADWMANVGETNIIGCLNTYGGTSAAMYAPECLPERLQLVSYSAEHSFFHDDVLDNESDPEVIHQQNDVLVSSLHAESAVSKAAEAPQKIRSKQQLQARIAVELLSIDKDQGSRLLEEWEEVLRAAEVIRESHYDTLDDFLAMRIQDFAAKWIFSLLRFGLDIHLSDEEKALAAPMEHLVALVLILQNEYFSYDKEHRAWVADGQGFPLVNGVSVIMKVKDCNVDEAKEITKREMMRREMDYVKLRDNYIQQGNPAPGLMRYFAGLEYLIAGSQVWSMSSPRYHLGTVNPYLELKQKTRDSIAVKQSGVNRGIDWVSKLAEIKAEQ